MIKENIILTPQDILEKEFKIDTRGFRCKEVDQFLDVIMKDYDEYDKIVDKLQSENKHLQEEIIKLKSELRNARVENETRSFKSEREVTNVDILKRLSQLEKIVYGIQDK